MRARVTYIIDFFLFFKHPSTDTRGLLDQKTRGRSSSGLSFPLCVNIDERNVAKVAKSRRGWSVTKRDLGSRLLTTKKKPMGILEFPESRCKLAMKKKSSAFQDSTPLNPFSIGIAPASADGFTHFHRPRCGRRETEF